MFSSGRSRAGPESWRDWASLPEGLVVKELDVRRFGGIGVFLEHQKEFVFVAPRPGALAVDESIPEPAFRRELDVEQALITGVDEQARFGECLPRGGNDRG